MMRRYSPMLCDMGSKSIFRNKNFSFEIKLDGTRIILYKKGKNLEMINRRGNSKLEQYPELKDLHRQIDCKSCVLDGELIIYDEKGFPNFNLLQTREQVGNKFLIDVRSKQHPATYVVFDILEKEGKSLISLPLTERRKILKSVVKENRNLQIIFSSDNGPKLWRQITKNNLEGVVAKIKNSRYEPGIRSKYWLKIKNLKTADVVLIGYTSEKRIISALCMAVYIGKKLHYIGRVGTGFTEKFLEDLHGQMKKIEISRAPVDNPPKREIHWVKPKLIGEVEYLYVSKYRELRAPSFKRLRFDKPAEECTWQSNFGKEIK